MNKTFALIERPPCLNSFSQWFFGNRATFGTGWLPMFDVLAISEELSLHKPDRALFQWAMDRAGVSPDEAVRVGDRHDNDVVPAAGLGMHTIWVRWLSHADKGWHPQDPLARDFLESQDREPFYAQVG